MILMASRAMAASAQSAEDYLTVYGSLLNQASNPVILHWLGDMFDPALAGYWGSADIPTAMATVLELINANPAKVDGIKVSLLDADYEIELRRRLPEGVRLYTGDDFNYPELIKGDEHGHSDALLGIFDGIARPASQALRALDRGDLATYDRLMGPTVALSRHIFEKPTFHYKTGLVFLAYLNGHQDHFRMVGGLETARDAEHLTELLRLAEIAGVLDDPELAADAVRGGAPAHEALAESGHGEAPHPRRGRGRLRPRRHPGHRPVAGPRPGDRHRGRRPSSCASQASRSPACAAAAS